VGPSYRSETEAFSRIWEGGYYESNPLDPFDSSSYLAHGFMNTTYVTYLMCIKPFVDETTTVLEIGPGRGAWTKTFVERGAKEIWALDAAPPEHTRFHDHVGRHDHVHYVQVSDCELRDVEDDSIDYFFTFGVFCHLPNEMVADYIAHLPAKLRSGANGFLMVGDFDKYNRCIVQRDALEHLFEAKRYAVHRYVDRAMRRVRPQYFDFQPLDVGARIAKQGEGGIGAWHHMSTTTACELLEAAGLEIVTSDVEANPRDPIIHFRKP
jgi:hypothetical protein